MKQAERLWQKACIGEWFDEEHNILVCQADDFYAGLFAPALIFLASFDERIFLSV